MNDTKEFDLGREIHLWVLRFSPTFLPYETMFEVLAPIEKERANRYKRQEDSLCFITSRYFLRSILSSYLKISSSQIEIIYQMSGKPRVESLYKQQALHFNLSHSKNAILIGCALGREIGVDIEYKLPLEDMGALAKLCMSSQEYETWLNAAPKEKETLFYRCWVLKEAYLKGIGTGLLENRLTTVEVQPNNKTAFSILHERGFEWQVQEIPLFKDYFLAIAFQRRNVLNLLFQTKSLMKKEKFAFPALSVFENSEFFGCYALKD